MNYVPPPNKLLYFDQVWMLVRQIPYGKVATYGQISKLLSQPTGVSSEEYRISAARWVGLAMAGCPDDVPWQRVVNSQGKISHQAEPGKQKRLLEAEGVLLVQGKIDLHEYQWCGPGQSDAPQQGRLF